MNDLADLVGALVQAAARLVNQGCIFGCTDADYWSCGDDGVR